MGVVIYMEFGDGLNVSNINEVRTAATYQEGFDENILTSASVNDRPLDKWKKLDQAVYALMDGLREHSLPPYRNPPPQVAPEDK